MGRWPLLLLLLTGALTAADLPSPWKLAELGSVKTPGRAAFEGGEWTFEASGADFWGTADSGSFLYQPLKGDGTLVCRLDSLEAPQDWTKCGLMARATLAPDSPYALVLASGANQCHLQWRERAGGESGYTQENKGGDAPCWLKLVRDGHLLTGFCSRNGHEWTKVGQIVVELPEQVFIGVALTSHDNNTAAKAVLQKLKLAD